MAIVDLGETYSSPNYEVRDASGVLQDAGTVTAVVTLPDATTSSPTVTHASTGTYNFDYLTTLAGRHEVVVTATGGILGTLTRKWADVFDVDSETPVLVSVDEAIAHLRATGIITTAADREQLRWLCSAATDAVERDIGRAITRRTVTELYDGGYCELIMLTTPIISVTTVVESGTTLSPSTDFFLASNTSLLYRGTTIAPRIWMNGRQNISVTYVAGYIDPPRIARKVCLNGVQRMWQQSQQQPHAALDPDLAVVVAIANLTPLEMSAYYTLRGI